MPGNGPQNMLEDVTKTFAGRVQDYARGMAQHLGGPLSGRELSQDEAVQRWNYTPLGNSQLADQHYYDLLQQGLQPGQALDQVYPLRKQLMQGPDIESIVGKAKQLADWSAQATGQAPPPPYTQNTLPLLHLQQQPPPMPPQPPPMSMPGGLPTPSPGMPPPPPGPMPPMGGPPVAPPAAAPGMMPPGPPPLPPPATTAPPNAEGPLGGGLLPPAQGPTGNLQA